MTRVWLKSYREGGIPEQIDADAHRSVVAMLEAAMKTYAARPAFRCPEKSSNRRTTTRAPSRVAHRRGS